MDPSSLSSSPKKPVILKDGDNVNEIAKRNLLASTVLTALLGYSVHRPNIVLFFFGWPVSVQKLRVVSEYFLLTNSKHKSNIGVRARAYLDDAPSL